MLHLVGLNGSQLDVEWMWLVYWYYEIHSSTVYLKELKDDR